MENIEKVVEHACAIVDGALAGVERTKYSGIAISVKDMQEIKRALLVAKVMMAKPCETTRSVSWPDIDILHNCEVGKEVYRVGINDYSDRFSEWLPYVQAETIIDMGAYGGRTTNGENTTRGTRRETPFEWSDIGQTVFFNKEDAEKLSSAIFDVMRNWTLEQKLYIIDANNDDVHGPYEVAYIGEEGVWTKCFKFSWISFIRRFNDIFTSKETAMRELERRWEAAC